ncbi:hypothetical protein GCM10022215_13120 [Nocardioides fonticola]|uniref:Uncharacterized protein n=1 Tax=Nocardioides fonticola TaxID=450363 RepID=A0ABP7XFL9_9ACTN
MEAFRVADALEVLAAAVKGPSSGSLRVEVLATLFEEIALGGGNVPEVVAEARRLAAERLLG